MSDNDSSDDPGLAARRDADDTHTLSQLADHPKHGRWSGGHLTPGQRFGHFEVQRLLGAGGMGEVYEAFDHDTGRYVALKILSETLDSPEHRKRFLREGQLAARVSHPNSIYVYGTEEIDGNPVIIMELAAAGTLKDQVKADGPMQPRKAVDAVLQILDGLEAAAGEGVLHRDIKPSNCFIEPDGTTKIGDFGLSISTLAREETQLTISGSIVGTPAFASPEQLSGRALDARADIYSVGATLFYLLTSRAPFAANQPVELIARVLSEPAPSVRKLQSKVPRALARTVARCLAKDPAARFPDHAALRHALTPHGSELLKLAPLALRLAATTQDLALVLLGVGSIGALVLGREDPPFVWFVLAFLLVRTLSEGPWGTSPGKAAVGLRVVGVGRARPGLARALARSAILIWPVLVGSILGSYDPALELHSGPSFLVGVGWFLVVLVGLAEEIGVAPHDWLAGTRVIRDPGKWRRLYRAPDLSPPPAPTAGDSHIAPYRILERRASDAAGETYLAFDDTLERRLWLRVYKTQLPPAPAAERDLDRPSRLRWINGRRTAQENWDAWEYVPGETPRSATREKLRWRDVRGWLHSLAFELVQSSRESIDGSVAPSNLWLAEDGRAIVADFPFEDPAPGGAPNGDRSARLRLLAGVCSSLLEGRWQPHWMGPGPRPAVPVPLHARDLLERVGSGTLDYDEALAAIEHSSRLEPETSIRRRLFTLMEYGFLFFLALPGPWDAFFRGFARGIAAAGGPAAGLPEIGAAANANAVMLIVGLTSLAAALLLNRRVLLGAKIRGGGVWWSGSRVVFQAALVDGSGQELRRASRPLLIRTLVAWIPAWLAGALLLAVRAGIALPESVWLLPPLLLVAGGLYALANPVQGIQDRIAGTYLVPR